MSSETRFQVVQVHRRPTASHFSFEGYFERLRPILEARVSLKQFVVPSYSRGILGRLRNIFSVFRVNADIIHITGDIHYVAVLLNRSRTILTIHDCQILSRMCGLRRLFVKWLWFTLPCRCVSRISVVSEATKEALLKEVTFPPDRIHIIPVCVSSALKPDHRPFNTDCPRVLQIGTKANKNVPRLVRAISGLNVQLDIVGPVDRELSEVLSRSGLRYQVLGRLSDAELVERYRKADIVAFVSTEEGFGMPIIEAQNVERVCVTSNCSSMPEVAGAGACLVDPFDVQSIRSGFIRVISDASYREQIIAAGRENRKRFDAQRIAVEYADLYRLVHEELATEEIRA